MMRPRLILMLPVLFALNCARSEPKPPEAPAEPRISVNFDRVPLKTALELIARASGANIIAASDLTGTVTVSAQNSPWRDVLTTVTESCGMKLIFIDKYNMVRVVAP